MHHINSPSRLSFSGFLLFVFFAGQVRAQIAGRVTDSTGAGFPFCPVALLRGTDSSMVKGSLSDEKGRFEFTPADSGAYLVTAIAAGYKKSFSETVVSRKGEKLELAPMRLKGNGVNLKEVSIEAVRNPIEFKGGNVVANIEGSPLATGNSAHEVLGRLPGVMVDNDQIMVNGQGGVRVYIDDRLQQFSGSQLVNFLKGLNSEQIARIEIIMNPPAKYDAAGSGPIINIVTRKVKITGFSGNANYTFSKGYKSTNNGAFSLNYKGKKINVFSSVNGHDGRLKNEITFDRRFGEGEHQVTLNEHSFDINEARHMSANLGLDWYLNDRNTFGMKAQVFPGEVRATFPGTITTNDPSAGYRSLETGREYYNWWFYGNYNLNYEHKFDTNGTVLKIIGDMYHPYDDIYTNDYKTRFLDARGAELLPLSVFRSDNFIALRVVSLKTDFEKKLGKTGTLGAGLKTAFQDIFSDYGLERMLNGGEFQADSLFTNKFEYLENISGGYLTFQKDHGRFSYTFGLRAENTDVRTNSLSSHIRYTRQYFQVFPQFSLNYNQSANHIFSFSANTRVNRPDYNSFNPYRSFHNQLESREGNPFLLPEYSYNANFNYVYKGRISNTLFFNYSRNPFLNYPRQDDSTKTLVHRMQNVEALNHLRYIFYMRKDVRKWYTVGVNIGIYYVDMKGPVEGSGFFNSALPWWIWSNQQFILPKNFRVELMAFYWSPWLGGVGRMEERWGIDLALKKSFLDKKLTFTLAANDIFFSKKWTSTVQFRNQDSRRVEANDTRRFNIGVSYNFGKVKVEQRQVDRAEEGDRIGR